MVWFHRLDTDPNQTTRHVLLSTSQTNKQTKKALQQTEKTNMQQLMAEIDIPWWTSNEGHTRLIWSNGSKWAHMADWRVFRVCPFSTSWGHLLGRRTTGSPDQANRRCGSSCTRDCGQTGVHLAAGKTNNSVKESYFHDSQVSAATTQSFVL